MSMYFARSTTYSVITCITQNRCRTITIARCGCSLFLIKVLVLLYYPGENQMLVIWMEQQYQVGNPYISNAALNCSRQRC